MIEALHLDGILTETDEQRSSFYYLSSDRAMSLYDQEYDFVTHKQASTWNKM